MQPYNMTSRPVFKLIVSLPLVICLSATGFSNSNGLTLDQILQRMHSASLKLSTIQAGIAQERAFTDIGGGEHYRGDMFLEHGQREDKLRIWYKDNGGQIYQDVAIDGNTVKLYQPRINQMIITTRSKQASQDPEYDFIATPYSSVSTLKTRYNISYVRDESVGGVQTAVVELKPKAPSKVSKFTLWVDQNSWMPIKYQVTEHSVVTSFTLSNVQRNGKLPSGIFNLSPPRGTKIVRQ